MTPEPRRGKMDDPTTVIVTDGSDEAEADVMRGRLRAAADAIRAEVEGPEFSQ